MANWKASNPKDTWNAKERGDFEREVWTRFKFFTIDVPGGLSVASGGTLGIDFTVVGGGGTVETDFVRGLRLGMPVKLTYCFLGVAPPTAGLTWDCAVQADDTLNIWFNNSSGGGIAIQDGPWSVMGIVT